MNIGYDPPSARQILEDHQIPEDVIDGILCRHAHELAEKQRVWAATQGGRELRIEPEQLPSIVQAAVGLAADLIDPEKGTPR